MRRLLTGNSSVKGPVRNDRVAINAINKIRRNLDLSCASDEHKYVLLSTVSYFIGAMEYTTGHTNVVRTWRKLVNDCFPNDGHRKYQWIDESVRRQKES